MARCPRGRFQQQPTRPPARLGGTDQLSAFTTLPGGSQEPLGSQGGLPHIKGQGSRQALGWRDTGFVVRRTFKIFSQALLWGLGAGPNENEGPRTP